MSEGAIPWLRFRIAGHELAIPLGAVAEVTPAAEPRLIPLVPLAVGGVVNLRGEPLPVVDGAALLGIRLGGPHQHALVLERDSARVGVLVEQVSLIDSRFKRGTPCQDADQRPGSGLVDWVHREREIVGLVDPSALFERAVSLLAGKSTDEGVGRCSAAF